VIGSSAIGGAISLLIGGGALILILLNPYRPDPFDLDDMIFVPAFSAMIAVIALLGLIAGAIVGFARRGVFASAMIGFSFSTLIAIALLILIAIMISIGEIVPESNYEIVVETSAIIFTFSVPPVLGAVASGLFIKKTSPELTPQYVNEPPSPPKF
jgi:hypothetical protein